MASVLAALWGRRSTVAMAFDHRVASHSREPHRPFLRRPLPVPGEDKHRSPSRFRGSPAPSPAAAADGARPAGLRSPKGFSGRCGIVVVVVIDGIFEEI